MGSLAPVIVFAYKRRNHIERLFASLVRDELAAQSEVFVFVDGARGDADREAVEQVRRYVRELEQTAPFRALHAEISEENKGLARSIIGGVSRIMERYGRAIIIEDDVVVADHFLTYMNDALNFYEHDPHIWSVGAFSFVRHFPADYAPEVFFTQRSSSYAWASWRDRWEKIDWDVRDHAAFRRSLLRRRDFNRWGSDRSTMLDAQMAGRVNSWAIRFDYAMWKNAMYNVVPRWSRCATTGHDGSGTHSGDTSDHDKFALECRVLDAPVKMSAFTGATEAVRREFCEYFLIPWYARAKRYWQFRPRKNE